MSGYGDGLRDAILMLKSAGHDEAVSVIDGVAEKVEAASNTDELKANIFIELEKWFDELVKDRPDGEYGEEARFAIRLHVAGTTGDDDEPQWTWTTTKSRERSQFS